MGKRKFSVDQIRDIRASDKMLTVLAVNYGVSKVAIWKIKHRRSYKDVKTLPTANVSCSEEKARISAGLSVETSGQIGVELS